MSIPPEQAQTIAEGLGYWAETTPDAIALLAPGREPASYRELHDAVERLAAELRSLGLGRQDGIALLLPEGPELCTVLLAAMSIGIAVPLVWPSLAFEYRGILANPRVRAIVVSGADGSSARDLAGTGLPVFTLSAAASGRLEEFRVSRLLGASGQRAVCPLRHLVGH